MLLEIQPSDTSAIQMDMGWQAEPGVATRTDVVFSYLRLWNPCTRSDDVERYKIVEPKRCTVRCAASKTILTVGATA